MTMEDGYDVNTILNVSRDMLQHRRKLHVDQKINRDACNTSSSEILLYDCGTTASADGIDDASKRRCFDIYNPYLAFKGQQYDAQN